MQCLLPGEHKYLLKINLFKVKIRKAKTVLRVSIVFWIVINLVFSILTRVPKYSFLIYLQQQIWWLQVFLSCLRISKERRMLKGCVCLYGNALSYCIPRPSIFLFCNSEFCSLTYICTQSWHVNWNKQCAFTANITSVSFSCFSLRSAQLF